MRWQAGITIVTAAGAALAGLAPPASATYPGPRGPIAFQRLLDPAEENSGQIFRVAPGGRKAQRLTHIAGGAFAPEYSPDGATIAFELRTDDGSPDSLWTTRADGSETTRFPAPCTDPCLGEGEPSWTPSGGEITFERAFGPIVDDNASEVDIAIAGTDGSDERVLRRFIGDGTEPHGQQWSPDGRLLAVTIQNTTRKPQGGSTIHLFDAQGEHVRRITPPRLNAGNPDWSPDGRRIVFNSSYEGQGKVELYTVRPDGSALRRLRRERKSISFEPVWSPDGGRIAFVHATPRTAPHIWTIGPDGKKMRQETRGRLPDFAPDWGAGG
jgi:Tol biopolymer transport system component